MPSTYTTSGIELIGDGEQSGVWGDTTNNNLQILDRLISQAGTIPLSGTTHTLTISDGTLSDGQYAVVVFGGSLSATNTVTISPNDAKRVFIVKNATGQTVTLTQGSGGNVSVLNGRTAIVYCDGAGSGAAVVNVSDTLVSGTLSAIGALTPTDGNFIVGNGTTWVAESGNTVLTSIGVTATAAELNTLDGITASTAELNTLDGITATTTELNYVDGVTSNVQTQLNAKQPLDAELTAIAALTPTDGNFIVGNGTTWVAESGNTVLTSLGVTATIAEINKLDGVTATTAELNYVDGVTSNIQTQLNAKQPLDADLTAIAALTPTDGNFIVGNGSTWVAESGNTVLTSIGVTATAAELNTLDGITASTAELNYVDGVTSNVQTQLNAKQATITGGATTITSSNLTASRALVSDGSGKVAVSAVTSTEVGYLDGVTSAIQTQLDAKAANTTQTQAAWEAGTSTTETIVSPAKVKQAIDALAGPTLGTAQASTSGTNIDFTGIPAGAKRVTVIFVGTSLSGSSSIIVQLGTSGGFVTTGYEGASYIFAGGSNAALAPTNGLPVTLGSSTRSINGTMTLNLATGNTWVASVSGGASAGSLAFAGGGNIALGGTLTQLRITTINGTDTFDAGTVNIMWE